MSAQKMSHLKKKLRASAQGKSKHERYKTLMHLSSERETYVRNSQIESDSQAASERDDLPKISHSLLRPRLKRYAHNRLTWVSRELLGSESYSDIVSDISYLVRSLFSVSGLAHLTERSTVPLPAEKTLSAIWSSSPSCGNPCVISRCFLSSTSPDLLWSKMGRYYVHLACYFGLF